MCVEMILQERVIQGLLDATNKKTSKHICFFTLNGFCLKRKIMTDVGGLQIETLLLWQTIEFNS